MKRALFLNKFKFQSESETPQVIALTLTLSIGKIVAESKLLVRTGMELNQNFKHDLSTNLKKIDKHVSYSEPETYQQIQFCT